MHSVRDFWHLLKFPQTRVAIKFLSPLPQKTEELFVIFFLFQSLLTVHKTRLNNQVVQLSVRPPVGPKPAVYDDLFICAWPSPACFRPVTQAQLELPVFFLEIICARAIKFTGHSSLFPTLLRQRFCEAFHQRLMVISLHLPAAFFSLWASSTACGPSGFHQESSPLLPGPAAQSQDSTVHFEFLVY